MLWCVAKRIRLFQGEDTELEFPFPVLHGPELIVGESVRKLFQVHLCIVFDVLIELQKTVAWPIAFKTHDVKALRKSRPRAL